MTQGPLTGVRVVDLTRLLPGAFATCLLADLGADVIKVEQPGRGDYMRWNEPRLGPESAHSWVLDRNKRSVALDLKDPAGVAALRRLVAGADCLVESFRPGVADRLGIGYDELRAIRPQLVFCSITGYGQDGPRRREAGHDINYTGRAGVLGITGTADRELGLPGVQVADIGAGSLLSTIGLLAALLRARETGEGDHVDLSMTDGAFAWAAVHLADVFAGGPVPGPGTMPLNGAWPSYNVYACRDGRHVTVGALEPQFWQELCEAVGRPDLLGTHSDPEAIPTWRAVWAGRTRDEWLELLAGREVCVGPVNDLQEAAEDEQLRAREMVVELEHPDAGPLPQIGLPIKLRNNPGSVRSPAPALGASTREVLAELGYAGDELEALAGAAVAPAGTRPAGVTASPART